MKRTNRTLETLVIALLAMTVQTVWADEVTYINAAGKTATHDAIILDGTESSLGQQARQFVQNFGDDSEGTGIISVSKESGSKGVTAAWYTLDGRKLDAQPTKKGLYIHEGRKPKVVIP